MRRILLAAAILSFAARPLAAQPYEVVVAGIDTLCGIITPPLVPVLQWFGDEPLLDHTSTVSAVAPGPEGRIYGIGRRRDIVRVRRGLPPVTIATTPAGYFPERLVLDAASNIYVLTYTPAVLAYTPDGTLRATYPLASSPWDDDLAADQCTLFYIGRAGAIRRLNVCTGAALPDFANVPGARALRILPDGGAIVATATQLVRLNATGAETRRYSDAGWQQIGAIALANGGTTLWLADAGCDTARTVEQIDLATGARIRTFELFTDLPTSIVASASWTAAIGTGSAHGAAQVPAASTWGLIALAAFVAITAVRRIA
jgi:hypothetical protein